MRALRLLGAIGSLKDWCEYESDQIQLASKLRVCFK